MKLLLLPLLLLPPQDPMPPQQPGMPPIPADKGEVQTTESGLKYSVLAEGSGDKPDPQAYVTVHYTGWLTDGKVFDSSVERGEPITFNLGGVIKGWSEGVALMSKGAKYKLTIPPELGYGAQGAGGVIPPNATLVFQVELLDFMNPPAFPAADEEANKKTESGIAYQVLKEGEGEPPKANEGFTFSVALWKPDGKLLQWSNPKEPNKVPAAGALRLPFMQEILPMMKPGSRWRLEVPPKLAFGEQAAGPELPANSPTVWELQMHEVMRAQPVPEFVLPADEKLTKTSSGLRYEVVEEGKGESPTPFDSVTVHYAGWLTDGTLFDASFPRGEPSQFGVGQVIPGWQEGLQLMKPGAVYRFVIPSELAYGKRGQGKIGPDATLVFYVKLLKVGS